MKNLNKVAMLFASVALTAPMIGFAAGHTGMAKPIAKPTAEQFKYASGADQWRAADGTVWMNGTNELCWRDANWTPATAYPGCDGAAMPPAAPKAPRPPAEPR